MNARLFVCGRFLFAHVQDCRLQAKGPGFLPGLCIFIAMDWMDLEVHAAHAAAARHCRSRVFFFGISATIASVVIKQAGDRSRVLDRRTHDLGRVDDALGDQVAVLAGLRVEAVGVLILLQDLADDDRAVLAGIGGDLAGRSLDRLADDLDAVLLVFVLGSSPA